MKTDQAIKIIENYNLWRQGLIEEYDYEPKEITEALNVLIEKAKC